MKPGNAETGMKCGTYSSERDTYEFMYGGYIRCEIAREVLIGAQGTNRGIVTGNYILYPNSVFEKLVPESVKEEYRKKHGA